ncbi:MAG: stage II sporulation protein M [Gammaproteobacteria bacterium]|nr:stage II sporulation protein M [Gammaproteobacteria bacterium]
MKQDLFVERYENDWNRLDELLSSSRWQVRRSALAPSRSELPHLYRQVCHHLALARERGYSLALVDRLHGLCLRGHQALYVRRFSILAELRRFVLADFPRLVRANWIAVLAAAVFLCGSGLTMGRMVYQSPHLIYSVTSPDSVESYESMYDPAATQRVGRARQADDDFEMFGFYLRNNTSIGFRTFAAGLLFGVGTIVVLLFNGVTIGATAGYLSTKATAIPFWSFVSGHSAPEITAIVLSGAAGLLLGWALVAPGRRTRQQALLYAAKDAVRIMYGAAALFFVAAIVEAYWSSIVPMAPETKWAVGVAGWVVLWSYLILAGRERGR